MLLDIPLKLWRKFRDQYLHINIFFFLKFLLHDLNNFTACFCLELFIFNPQVNAFFFSFRSCLVQLILLVFEKENLGFLKKLYLEKKSWYLKEKNCTRTYLLQLIFFFAEVLQLILKLSAAASISVPVHLC